MFSKEQQAMFGTPGYQYNGATPAPKINNALTAEEIKKLQQNQAEFSLAISQEEYLRGICTHRTLDGNDDSLVFDNETGLATCTVCGYTFRPLDKNCSIEEIQNSVDTIVDILQTIKLLYLDLPAEAAREFFQIIPMLEKTPKLFEFAAKNMTKHESLNWTYNQRNMGAVGMFQNLQNMFATMNQQPGPGVYAGTATPNMNPFTGAPVYPGPVAGGPNPAAAVQAGYAPNMGFQFNPNPVAATAPVQPTVAEPAAQQQSNQGEASKTVTQSIEV